MPNNNPQGENSFSEYGQESPYGAVKRLQDTIAQAPVPGGSALAAPRRLQRRATRQTTAPAAAPAVEQAPVAAPEMVQPSPAVRLATQWQTIAQVPGASPLVQEYAQVAQQQNQG